MADLGLIGLGVMGRNLALNMDDNGFSLAVWNLEEEVTDRFLEENGGRNFVGTKSFEELVKAVEKPRRIMMMIKSGDPVDQVIKRIAPLLDEGDILFDGGNSHFERTREREAALREKGILYFGVGISGGEEGARHGPSIMPGGDRDAYQHLHPVLEKIAAVSDAGPCVGWIGPDGAGHFVKMVHNGIEYGDMQLLAEAYHLLRVGGGLEAPELAVLFAEWNGGELESFLLELTADIFAVTDDETGRPLVEMVVDRAGQKGTGRWTVQTALELGVSVPTIAAALDARILSSRKAERVHAETIVPPRAADRTGGIKKDQLIRSVREALYASKICAYAQGLELIRAASSEFGWDVDLSEIARIWKAGCIIRARILDPIREAFTRTPQLDNLIFEEPFLATLLAAEEGWRYSVKTALHLGIPVPALGASLAWFDASRTALLPQNLTQAQRDAFGAHTYERTDKPGKGPFHTDWLGEER